MERLLEEGSGLRSVRLIHMNVLIARVALGDKFDYFRVFVFVKMIVFSVKLYYITVPEVCFYSNGPNGAVTLMHT